MEEPNNSKMPGFTIKDIKTRSYLLKFNKGLETQPVAHIEILTHIKQIIKIYRFLERNKIILQVWTQILQLNNYSF